MQFSQSRPRLEPLDNELTPLYGEHSQIKRKYSAEAGLHLFTGGPAMLRPSDLYRFADNPQFREILTGTNIYLICRRRRISICPQSIEVKEGELYGEFIVHGDSYFEWERKCFTPRRPHIGRDGRPLRFVAVRPADPFGHAVEVIDENGARCFISSGTMIAQSNHTVPRSELVEGICTLLRTQGAAFLIGGSGMGKTTLARSVANRLGGKWLVLSLLDRSAQESERLISIALGQIAGQNFSGLIVDDFNELDSSTAGQRFAQLVAAVRRRDAVCIVTSYKEPITRALELCGFSNLSVIKVHNLNQDEVSQLVSINGGDSVQSARLVFVLSSMGHPQLVKAVIAS